MKRNSLKAVIFLTVVTMLLGSYSTAFAAATATDFGFTVSENANGTLKVTPTATLVNKDKAATDKGAVIYAAYKGDEMVGISFHESAEIPVASSTTNHDYGNEACTFAAIDNLPAYTDTVKAFVWNDMNTATPLEKVLSYKLNDGFPEPILANAWGGTDETDSERGNVKKLTFNNKKMGSNYVSDFAFGAREYLEKHGGNNYILECWVKPSVSGRKLQLTLMGENFFDFGGGPSDRSYGTKTLIDSTVAGQWTKVKVKLPITTFSNAASLTVSEYAADRGAAGIHNGAFRMTDANGSVKNPLPDTEFVLIDDFKFYKEIPTTVAADNNLIEGGNVGINFAGAYSFEKPGLFAAKTGNIEVYSGDAHTGNNSYKLNATTSDNAMCEAYWYTGNGYASNLVQGKKYVLSFYMKQIAGEVSSDAYSVFLRGEKFKFADATNKIVLGIGRQAKLNEWVKVSLECELTGTVANGTYFVLCTGTTTPANVYLFDDFKITEIAE